MFTGFALARGGRDRERAAIVSEVRFRTLADAEVERYIATSEPYDKAGGYAIQGDAGDFIAAVEGSTANVMGLPDRRSARSAAPPRYRNVGRRSGEPL